jgi:uncharacterized protein YodC (DUF2158 family)
MLEGDIVKLKSGGPEMVIEKIIQDYTTNFEEICKCTWFINEKLNYDYFNIKTLKKI